MGKVGLTEIIVLFFVLFLYFLPVYIAFKRKVADRNGILVLNLFLGWSGLGWIASLIWACVGTTDTNVVQVNTGMSSYRPTKEGSFDEKMGNIQKLKELLDSGAITQEEFQKQKSRFLS